MPYAIDLKFSLPTTRKDGSALSAADIISVRVYRTVGAAAQALLDTIPAVPPGPMPYTDTNGLAPGPYGYNVSIVDELGHEGDQSPAYPIVIPVPEAAPSAPTILSAVVRPI